VPVAGSVIDLTADSPVTPVLLIAKQTSINQSAIFLDDSIDISSPVKQSR
jgi:hypothetical protein